MYFIEAEWRIFTSVPISPWKNGCYFADDIFKRIFSNENVRISIQFALRFVPKCPIDNKSALVQVKAWRLFGAKPLPDKCWPSSTTDICGIGWDELTRPSLIQLLAYGLFLTKRFQSMASLHISKGIFIHGSSECWRLQWRWSSRCYWLTVRW